MPRFVFVVLFAAALAAPFLAQQAATLRPLDIFDFELATDPQISPDGTRIVYVRQFADIMGDRRYSNLWIINFDGSNHRPLTTGNFNDTSPRWSHDGTQIAYISDREGAPQIYSRWMDTGQTAKLTNLQSPPGGISWSPDGKWISFTALVPDPGPKIATLPTAPEGAKWAEPAKVIDRLVYRFNAAGYLKPGYSHIFVVPGEGGTARQISTGKFHHAGPAIAASEAVWTPDGKYLLISTNRHPDYDLEPIDTEVYEFRVSDGAVRALTSRKGPDGSPVVSPDGTRIAYVGFDDRYQGYQVTQLYVMKRDGSNSHLVSRNYDRDVMNPRWAPDGRGVYFVSDDHGNTGLYYISLEGTIRKLTGNLGASSSAYGGGAKISLANNGNFAITYARPNVPGDIAAGSLADPAPRVLTSVNVGLFTGKKLGELEEIWYESSKDKRKIQGWIMKPPGFDPAKKYPLILEIHGGPFADYGDRFDLESNSWSRRAT